MVEVYEYGEYKRRKMCWHETDLYCVPSDGSMVYARNLSNVFRHSRTSYPIAVKSGCVEDIGRYLKKEKERPLIEMCMKAGLTMLGRYFLNDWGYKNTCLLYTSRCV